MTSEGKGIRVVTMAIDLFEQSCIVESEFNETQNYARCRTRGCFPRVAEPCLPACLPLNLKPRECEGFMSRNANDVTFN